MRYLSTVWRGNATVNILAFGTHPSDISYSCAGTLVKYAQAGHAVSIAVMCQGDCVPIPIDREESLRIREEESRKAAAIIGATLYHIGFSDFRIPRDEASKDRILRVIREVQPDIIITHGPGDYLIDHTVTSELVEESSLMAPQIGIVTDSLAYTRGARLLHMDTLSGLGFTPDEFVDITDVFETKLQMLLCHESALAPWRGHPVLDTVEMMEVAARYRGIQANVRYAEAFRRDPKWGWATAHRFLP